MKAIYFLFVVAAIALQVTKQDKCHLREMDLCATTGLLVIREHPVPQTEEQIDTQCNGIKETKECVQNFTEKCITKLHRELLSFIGEGPQSTVKEYCTAGSDLRKSVLTHSACLADAWKEQSTCTSDAQAAIETVETASRKDQLDIMCCTYLRFRKCSADLVHRKCGNDVVDFMDKLSGVLVSNLPNLICNSCKNNESKCNGLLPAPGTPPKGNSSNSIFSQLLSMYSS